MYRPSESNYRSWTSSSGSYSAPSNPTTSPGPMPGAPHLHPVSLPHPNSAPPHASSSSSQYQPPFEGSSGIVSLNPLLSSSWMNVPQLYYNVTRDIRYIRLPPNSPPNLLHAPAVHPVCTQLVLSIPSLPLWSTIEVRNPGGVTVYDVLVRIRSVLDCSVSATEMGMGVKRIDFLGPNILFAGLSRSMDGRDRWEVRFVPGA